MRVRRAMLRSVGLALCLTCLAPVSAAGATRATLTHVFDGDTVEVELRGGGLRDVRLIGIDTPEFAHFGDPAECGAAEATDALERFVGASVRLVTDPTQDARDRYGRLLRYVVTAKRGKDIGRRQVARGLAAVYVYEFPFLRLASYRAAAERAKASGLGAWSLCDGDFHRPLQMH